MLKVLQPLATKKCLFANLPTARSGPLGEGVTADEMADYTTIPPRFINRIDQAVSRSPVRVSGFTFAVQGGPLAQFFGLHQLISETQQPKNLQGWQGRWKLGGSKLRAVEPFLHGQSLDCSVSF